MKDKSSDVCFYFSINRTLPLFRFGPVTKISCIKYKALLFLQKGSKAHTILHAFKKSDLNKKNAKFTLGSSASVMASMKNFRGTTVFKLV